MKEIEITKEKNGGGYTYSCFIEDKDIDEYETILNYGQGELCDGKLDLLIK